MKINNIRGISMLEYAVLFAAVSDGLIAMSGYYGRTVQGRWRSCADVFGFGRQYDAKQTTVTPALTTTYENIGGDSSTGYKPPEADKTQGNGDSDEGQSLQDFYWQNVPVW